MLEGDPDAARALVSRELRGLDGSDATSAMLRRTLRSYLAASRSPDAAGRALGVHKNTVRYRIQRAEELLGRPVGPNRLKLELALEYADTYGPGLDGPGSDSPGLDGPGLDGPGLDGPGLDGA